MTTINIVEEALPHWQPNISNHLYRHFTHTSTGVIYMYQATHEEGCDHMLRLAQQWAMFAI